MWENLGTPIYLPTGILPTSQCVGSAILKVLHTQTFLVGGKYTLHFSPQDSDITYIDCCSGPIHVANDCFQYCTTTMPNGFSQCAYNYVYSTGRTPFGSTCNHAATSDSGRRHPQESWMSRAAILALCVLALL